MTTREGFFSPPSQGHSHDINGSSNAIILNSPEHSQHFFSLSRKRSQLEGIEEVQNDDPKKQRRVSSHHSSPTPSVVNVNIPAHHAKIKGGSLSQAQHPETQASSTIDSSDPYIDSISIILHQEVCFGTLLIRTYWYLLVLIGTYNKGVPYLFYLAYLSYL